MSIYATLREARVNWQWVVVQGVPGHIDDAGPDWDFLTPPIGDEDAIRTVFIIEARTTRKGTRRNGQEYHHWLLRLTGQEYYETPWPVLRRRIAKALREAAR